MHPCKSGSETVKRQKKALKDERLFQNPATAYFEAGVQVIEKTLIPLFLL